jgi:hypothetical protein
MALALDMHLKAIIRQGIHSLGHQSIDIVSRRPKEVQVSGFTINDSGDYQRSTASKREPLSLGQRGDNACDAFLQLAQHP